MDIRHLLRHAFLILTILTAAGASLRAQTGGEQFSFDDIPVDDVGQLYVALGGGYIGMVTFPKYDALNPTARALGLKDFSGPMTMHGGGGLSSFFPIPRLRVGIYGAAGSNSVEQLSDSTATSLRFSVGITALQADYAIRILRGFMAVPGVMLGSETYTVDMAQSVNPTYGGIFTTSQGPNHYARVTNTHFFLYPALNLEYTITQFLLIRGGVGYKTALGADSWTDVAGTDVLNVPAINANGMTVQFGLFLGLFRNQ